MEQYHIAIFWSHVNRAGPNGCWEWTASLSPNGYGQAWNGKKPWAGHRLSWEIANGPIPEGLWVLHKCPIKHNRKCVNPSHLKLGGVKENARDAVETGGIAIGDRHGSRTQPEALRRGEAHHMALVTDDQVMDARRRWSNGEASREDLAEEYGMTPGGIA